MPNYSKLTKHNIDELSKLAEFQYDETGKNLAAYTKNYRPVDGRVGGVTSFVLFPKTNEQVSNILKYCNENLIKVFVQGGNSGLVGGSTPDDSGDGIILSLNRMNKILSEINENIFSVKLQAGVIIDKLNQQLADHNLFCSIKHGGTGSATSAGSVATNSGGENAIKYGVTRDQVIGLTIVLPNGEILKLGGNIKDTANNLLHLFIGAEGIFGVITEVEFKVYHLPQSIETALVAFDNLESIQQFLTQLKKEFGRDGIETFEFMNNFIFNASKNFANGAEAIKISDSKKAYVMFEVSATIVDENLKNKLLDFLEKNQSLIDFENSIVPYDISERKLLWHIREHCTDASKKFSDGNAVRFDTCVPIDKISISITETENRLRQKFPNEFNNNIFKFIAFGHYGDGNIHIHISQDKNSITKKGNILLQNKQQIEDIVLSYQVTELGGSASAEHGFGRLTNKYNYYPKAQRELIKSMKNLFDKNNILNPKIGVPE